jgi:hypothetical protein
MQYNNKNIDSIRRAGFVTDSQRNTNQKHPALKDLYAQDSSVQKSYSLLFEQPKNKIGFKLPRFKTAGLVVTSIFLTAMISVAGQGLASKGELEVTDNLSNNWNQRETSLELTEAKSVGIKLASVDTPKTDVVVYTDPGSNLSPEEKQRAVFIKDYLTKRKSPAAAYAEDIAKLSQWKLVIGIMRAESQWCSKHVASTKNCHGIGGAWNLKKYNTYAESFTDVNRIIQTKYVDYGLNTPERIVKKYVGHDSPNWVAAVNAELNNLKNIP